jgi:hypothetical protein
LGLSIENGRNSEQRYGREQLFPSCCAPGRGVAASCNAFAFPPLPGENDWILGATDRMIQMEKFGFRIQTRSGLAVDNLTIQANDQAAAEVRLKQMYMGCTIIEVKVLETTPMRGDGSDLEGVINLISGQGKPG